MTYLDIYQSCVNLFLDNWTHTEIELEGSKLSVDKLDEFVRLQVFNDDSRNFSHAKTPNRLLVGHVSVAIYIRRGDGIGRLIELTDLCYNIFNNTQLANGLKFYGSEVIDRQQMISGETVVDPNWVSKIIITKFMAPL